MCAMAGVYALALPAGAALAGSDNSEILAVEVEIQRLRSVADAIQTEKVNPTEAVFAVLARVNCKAACRLQR